MSRVERVTLGELKSKIEEDILATARETAMTSMLGCLAIAVTFAAFSTVFGVSTLAANRIQDAAALREACLVSLWGSAIAGSALGVSLACLLLLNRNKEELHVLEISMLKLQGLVAHDSSEVTFDMIREVL